MGPQEQVLGAALTLQCFPLSIFLRFATNRLEKLGAGSFVAMAQGRCAGGSVGWLGLPPQVCGSFSVRNLVLSWTGFKNVGDLHRELCWTLGWQQGCCCACDVFLPTRRGSGGCWSMLVGNPFPCPQITPNISPCDPGAVGHWMV